MKRYLHLVLTFALVAFADGGLEEGNRLYREGRFAEAAEAYRAAIEGGEATPELHYNLGTALLQLGEYAQAERAFQAALSAVDPGLRHRTFYNLGNRFLVAGRMQPDARAKGALLDAAVAAYKQALRLAPADAEAKWNYELALREREEHRREQERQQSGGGGGDGRSDDPQSGGGGAGDTPANAAPQGGGGDRPNPSAGEDMSRQQAEQILSAIEQAERELYRESLQKGRDPRRADRNW